MQNQIKKNTIIVLSLISSLFLFTQATGQVKATQQITELKIGDKIPDLVIERLFRKKGRAKIAELYKPGLLIINFWATWCVPCIRELPNLEVLKIKYANQFNVLSIAYQDSTAINKFLNKEKGIEISELFVVTNDNTLSKYFPHKYLPHNIWINKDGIIKAITDEQDITSENIQAFINNKGFKMNVKKDNLKFDFNKPFHLGDSIFAYRSIMTKYIDGIDGGNDLHGSHDYGIKTFFGWNISIVDLFYLMHTKYNAYYKIDYRAVQINTKDSLKFFRPDQITNLPNRNQFRRRIDWEKEHTFCYELTLPQKVADTLFYKDAIEDLKRIFNINYKTATRVLPCDVVSITKESKFKLENFRVAPDTLGYAKFFKYQLILKNATIEDLIHSVLSTWDPKKDLWVDATGIDYPISLVIDFDKNPLMTLQSIKDKLLEYGIKIEMQPHEYPIMILDDMAKN